MIQAEAGTVIHTNLSKLGSVLWPESSITQPINYFYRWNLETGKEEAWVRFIWSDNTFTYLLNAQRTQELLGNVEVEVTDDIIGDLKRYPYIIPASYLVVAEGAPGDTILQEEFVAIERNVAEFRLFFAEALKKISRRSDDFIYAGPRDHELWVSFSIFGEDKNTFGVRYDRIYPKLPEGGFSLGNGEELVLDIPSGDPKCKQSFNYVKTLEKKINRLIHTLRWKSQLSEEGTKLFDKEIRSLLAAGTHFTRRIYPFDGGDGKHYLEEVANEILDTLYAAQQRLRATGVLNGEDSIGLDVNSWIVWQYHHDQDLPVKTSDPLLDFQNIYLEGYLSSFTDVLMGYLMNLQHREVIRPYSYSTKADPNDGHAVGSFRKADDLPIGLMAPSYTLQ